jgi:lipopolysaccharide/colanic/teichoic acid biosynthesis glycosyltransferase
MKRLFDFFVALTAVAVLSPLLMLIAILIKLEDHRGPVLYRGVRVGRFGKPFRLYKFRSMVVNAEKIGGPSTSDDDPRITRLGKILRKYKLDELPELLNVVVGDMSLVGPRPEVQSEVDLYTHEERRLLTVRPGITDYSSIEFHDEGDILRGSVDPHEAYRRLIRPRKVALGLDYVNNPSLLVDLKILWLTLSTLVVSRVARRTPQART